jgi:hypothetical protein
MDHKGHAPGTSVNCAECDTLALEPGWYRTLREERVFVGVPDHLLILEGDDLEVILPDLEAITPKDPEG